MDVIYGCINRWMGGSQKLTKCTTLHRTMMTRMMEMSKNSAMPTEDPIVVVVVVVVVVGNVTSYNTMSCQCYYQT